MTDEFVGKKIGGYEVESRIGQGGMATVYRARQTSMNCTVALKILPRQFMRDDTYLQRFEREVKIIVQLEHRNIIPVYDYGEYEGQPYIAMRYMPGGTVDDLLMEGPLPIERILSIVEQVAPALDYAHSKNVLHRDLKPSNVLLDEAGGAYLTDFGIARILTGEESGGTITTQGVVGTPSYMSPEQAQGKPMDGRSDIYSLGVMLFEMTTGRRPFMNDTPYSIAVMQVTAQPPSPRSINPKITAAIEQVILKALKKNAENCYQTSADLSQSLRIAYERPTSVHDTQPRPISVRELNKDQTQPSEIAKKPVPSPPQSVRQVSPAVGQPPVYSPKSPSQPMRPAPPSGRINRRFKRKRRGSIWINMIIGALLGCGMLSALVAGMYVAADRLFGDDAEPTAEVTEDPDGPTLDPFSAAALGTLRGTGGTIEPTPLPDDTGTAATFTGEVVFFDTRDGNTDLFLLDVDTGEETRLTDDPGIDSYPMPAPTGKQVVFQSDRDGDFDIYVLDIETGDITQVTANTVLDRLPAWSYDGQWIVYSSDTRGDGNYDLYRVRPRSGEPQIILTNDQRNSHPRFSPDGAFVVFTTGSSEDAATWEIAVLNIATGDVRVLTRNDVRDASPSYSPDGSRVIFITGPVQDPAIATVPADGGATVVLHDEPGYEWGAMYSPSGQHVLFNVESGTTSRLMVMRADGTGVRELDNSGGYTPALLAD